MVECASYFVAAHRLKVLTLEKYFTSHHC